MNYQIKTILLMLLIPFAANSTDLQTAISSNMVKAQFVSNGGHRGKCLKLIIENKGTSKAKIQIQPGTYLENEDTTRQDIIVVDNEFFVLQAKEKREITLNGLCCKSKKGSPGKGKPFSIREKSSPSIQKLSELLLELNEFQYAGQGAMWNLIDKGDPNKIVGADSIKTMKLRQFVGKALNKKVKPFIWTDYNRPAIVVSNKLSLKSEGNHYVRNVKQNDLVQYAIYDEADQPISAVKSERVVANRWKKHNVVWKLAVEELNPTKKFYMRISVNGVIKKEWLYYFWG